jgi:hypothetical protein
VARGFAIGQNAYPGPVTATSRKWPLPGDPDASIGARHHRLPRFYLERFANEREQVATIDPRTGTRRTTAIKETAAEKDFYTAINAEGEKDGKTEHLLAHRGQCRPRDPEHPEPWARAVPAAANSVEVPVSDLGRVLLTRY